MARTIPFPTAPTVGLQPLSGPGPRVPGGTGYDRLGAGIEQASRSIGALGQAVAEAEGRAEDAAEMSAHAELESLATELYDDDQKGLLNVHGEAAFKQTDVVLGRLEQRRQELMKGMSEGSRLKFDLRTRSLVEQRRRQGEGHAAKERANVERIAVDRRLKSSLVTIRSTDDVEVRERATAVAIDAIEAFQPDPTLREGARLEFLDEAHSAALERMLDKRKVKEAREYFTAYRDQIHKLGPAFEERIIKAEMELSVDNKAMRMVQKRRAGEFGFVDTRALLEDMRTAIAETDDPDERDALRTRLIQYAKDEEGIKQATTQPVVDRILADFNRRKSRADVRRDDLVLLNRMDPPTRVRVDQIIGLKPAGASNSGLSKSNLMKLKEGLWQNEEIYTDPNYNLSMFERQWRHQLTDKDYATGWDLILKTKRGIEKIGRVNLSEFRRRAEVYATENDIGGSRGRGKKTREEWTADVMGELFNYVDNNQGKLPERETANQWFDFYNPKVEYPTGERRGIGPFDFGPKTQPLRDFPREQRDAILRGTAPSPLGERSLPTMRMEGFPEVVRDELGSPYVVGAQAPAPVYAPRAAAPAATPAGTQITEPSTSVPAVDRQQIIEALEATGRPVTEASILNWYQSMRR